MGREVEDMLSKMTEAHAESSGMKGEIKEFRRTKESLAKEFIGVWETHENLF